MKRSLKSIRSDSHAQFRGIRNFNNLIQGDDFEVAYNAASKEQHDQIEKAIKSNDRENLKEIIETILEELTPFDQMGIRRLRIIGRHLRIKGYAKKSKYDLVKEIQDVVHRLKENGK